MRDNDFQGSQRSELDRQLSELLRARHARRGQSTRNGCERTQTHTEERPKPGAGAGATQGRLKESEREGAQKAPDRDQRSGSRGTSRAARCQHERICRALRFQISKAMLECSLWKHDLSRDEISFARDGFHEIAQNGQCVLVESAIRADWRCGLLQSSLATSLDRVQSGRASWVRRTDRDVQGGACVAEGRGEDVGGAEVSARNDARIEQRRGRGQ